MTCPDRPLYEQALRSLQNRGAAFCVIGTFGLWLHGFELPGYPLLDCDLIAKNDSENLNLVAQVLQEQDWKMYLWNTPVAHPLPINELPGKYYLRAVRQTAVLDITYECEYIPWAEFRQEICWIESVPVASIAHILHLKKIRNTPKDQEILKQIARWT